MTQTFFFPYHRVAKILGIALVLFAVAGIGWRWIQGFTFTQETLQIPAQLTSLGLIFIFFSKERIEDERIHLYKFRALALGVLSVFFMTMPLTYLGITLSAAEFLSLVMTFATLTFYSTLMRQ